MEPGPPEVVLHSSWRGVILAHVASAALVALATWAFVLAGATVLSVLLGVAAVVVTAIVLFDYPYACAFGADGVERRCLLRRERLTWERIEMLTRTADRVRPETSDKPGDRRLRISRNPGGLVAVVGRRRYLLVNQCESLEECRVLRQGLAEWTDDTRWVAGLPPEDQPPTWLYRRRHHRPDNG